MDEKLIFLLATLLALTHQGSAQNNRFIVDINEAETVNAIALTLRCRATIISPRHVLTTASCAIPRPGWLLRVTVRRVVNTISGQQITNCKESQVIFKNICLITCNINSNPRSIKSLHPS